MGCLLRAGSITVTTLVARFIESVAAILEIGMCVSDTVILRLPMAPGALNGARMAGAMYVLLLITATTIGTVTVQQLGTFSDLQSCETAAAAQLTLTRVQQKPTVHFRCERERDS